MPKRESLKMILIGKSATKSRIGNGSTTRDDECNPVGSKRLALEIIDMSMT